MVEPQWDKGKHGRKKSGEAVSAPWLLVMLLLLPVLYVLFSFLETQFAPFFRALEWYRSLC